MTNLSKFLNASPSPKKSPEEQLIDAIINAGLTPPKDIYLDGKIHRFSAGTKGEAGHTDKSGWYVAYNDKIPAGKFGDWRSGVEQNWRAETTEPITLAEQMALTRRMAEAKAARDEELQKKHEIAEDVALKIWSECVAASHEHPYLQNKKINPNGARVTGDGRLVVPLYDEDGSLSSLQYISADGQKKYHDGGATAGCFNIVGNLENNNIIYIAEGFATAATIYETTSAPTVAAYSAGNLVKVTEIIKRLYPEYKIIVVADNDKSGVGKNYADQASAKYGVRVIMPPTNGDANDYKNSGGDLLQLLEPKLNDAFNKLDTVFGDALPADYVPPDELVENLITTNSLTIIYGDSNSGKTFFSLALARSVSSGVEVFGRQTDGGLVVYLATEAPASVRNRVQALKKYYNDNCENLCIVQAPVNFYTDSGDAADVIDLVKEIELLKNQRVKMIIADTLSRISAGANENSGEDMLPVMQRFDSISRETGAAIVIIHHTGKDAAKGARGWSGIRAHVDTEIEINDENGLRKATVTKQRELSSKGEDIYFSLEIIEMGTTKFGKKATTCVAIAQQAPEKNEEKNETNILQKHIRRFESAWFFSNCDVKNGSPYVTKSAMVDYLMSNLELSNRTAEQYIKPANSGRLISELLEGKIIDHFEHGWIVKCETFKANLLLRRNAK